MRKNKGRYGYKTKEQRLDTNQRRKRTFFIAMRLCSLPLLLLLPLFPASFFLRFRDGDGEMRVIKRLHREIATESQTSRLRRRRQSNS